VLVLAESTEVLVMRPAGERRCGLGDALPEHAALPGLAPRVRDLFRGIDDSAQAGI
jgi:hypothetical protein